MSHTPLSSYRLSAKPLTILMDLQQRVVSRPCGERFLMWPGYEAITQTQHYSYLPWDQSMQSFTVLPLYFHVGLSPAEPWEDASVLHPTSLVLRDSEDVELLRTSLGDEGLEEWDGVTLAKFKGLDVFSFLLFSSSFTLLLLSSSSLSLLLLSSSSLSLFFLSSSSLSLFFLSSSSLSFLFLSSSFSFLLRSREGLWGTDTVVLLGDTVVVLIPCKPVAVFCTEVNCCVCRQSPCVHTSGSRYGGGGFLPGSNEDDDGRETELLLLCADVFLAGVGVEDFGVGVERRCEVPIVMEVLLLLGRGEVKRSLLVTEFSELCRGSCELLPLAMLLLAATVLPVVLRHFSTVLGEWSNIFLLVVEGVV